RFAPSAPSRTAKPYSVTNAKKVTRLFGRHLSVALDSVLVEARSMDIMRKLGTVPLRRPRRCTGAATRRRARRAGRDRRAADCTLRELRTDESLDRAWR